MSNDAPRPVGTRYEEQSGEWMVTYEVINHVPAWDGGGLIEVAREVERRSLKPGPTETK